MNRSGHSEQHTELEGDGGTLVARSVQHDGFREFYVTGWSARSARPASAADASRALLGSAAALLAREGIQTISEKLYGTATERETVLGIRAAELDPSLPVTYVEHEPLGAEASHFAGLQIWGVAPDRGDLRLATSVGEGSAAAGRQLDLGCCRLLYLPAVTGTVGHDAPTQAREMFANASAALAAHGMGYPRVIRTWIYVARLLDWYDDFNRVRHEHHAAEGVGERDGSVLPASTGIQGGHQSAACVMDVLAVEARGSTVACPITSTDRQNAAPSYGSAFSRGMMLQTDQHRTIYVSGTASINATGASVHPGDPEAQCEETLLSVASVLDQRGATLADICSATLFCKTPEVAEAFRRVAARIGAPPMPIVPVLADVCRPELLVEMEAVAVI